MKTFAVLAALLPLAAQAADPPDFARDVGPILTKYCAGCHNAADAADNGQLALQDFDAVMQGGKHGPAVLPGKADESRLLRVVEGTAEPKMPPDGEPAPTAAEVAVLRAWVAAGAQGPAGDGPPPLVVPDVRPTAPVREAIHSAAWFPDGTRLAVGRYRAVDLYDADRNKLQRLDGFAGHVNAVLPLDGRRLIVAGGEPGRPGEITLRDVETGETLWTRPAHRDAVTVAVLSPDGKTFATGGYDQTIILHDAATGAERAVLTGHNGPVFGLAFHPKRPILASVSGDRTVKLWDARTGDRLDTLTEPTKEQVAVAFSPDGRRLAAAGADNRVRLWSVTDGRAGSTRLLLSHVAHEGPIVSLAFARDGRTLLTASEDGTLKVWDAAAMTQLRDPAAQPDWVSAIAVSPRDGTVVLGRLDGSLGTASLVVEAEPSPLTPARTPLVAVKPETVGTEPQESRKTAEAEPNDAPATATAFDLPGTANGVLGAAGDADFYRFTASAGEAWIFETNAARSKSPADTVIDVLHADGSPVERLRLRATRDSAINFRGIAADRQGVRVDAWEEMELNQFLYFSGEVCRILRMPQGPDGDMLLYAAGGKRESYFDTTAVAHALGEPAYVVEPYPSGAEPPANGLPVFPLYCQNDDDASRRLGRDSRLTFTAPAAGEYLLRVRDVRGFGGPDYKYSLVGRRPRPGFSVSVAEAERKVPAGSGQRLTLKADRKDGFDGPIAVTFSDLPPGLSVGGPVVIEAGHDETQAVLNAAADAMTPSADAWKAVTATATAVVAGREASRPITLPGKVTVEPKPKLIVTLSPAGDDAAIVLRPGESVAARLRIERNGFDGEMTFDVEGLPHGMIVDHIGLSGVLIRVGESERDVVLSCAKWVGPCVRPIFAVAKREGEQASRPVTLRIETPESVAGR